MLLLLSFSHYEHLHQWRKRTTGVRLCFPALCWDSLSVNTHQSGFMTANRLMWWCHTLLVKPMWRLKLLFIRSQSIISHWDVKWETIRVEKLCCLKPAVSSHVNKQVRLWKDDIILFLIQSPQVVNTDLFHLLFLCLCFISYSTKPKEAHRGRETLHHLHHQVVTSSSLSLLWMLY